MQTQKNDNWLFEISSKRKLIELNFKEIYQYRDLLVLFVKRDIVTVYKQTVLGPLWFFIQPLFTSVIFTLVFNNIAKINTGAVPPFLFNLSGITAWNYFRICLTGTSNTFRSNAGIFGKVYFPRFIVPLSKVISNLVKLGIQFLILIGFYIYYATQGFDIAPSVYTLLIPVYVLLMALYGLGVGMIISTLTTKYRDLSILLGFVMQLLMYISAVPYPMSELTDSSYGWVVEYNPLAYIIEGFRYVLFNDAMAYFSWESFGVISALALVLFVIGLALFNRTEKTFIDTV
ncbi:ABC transporter permease [Altibacter sp. HG106]|uniref:ABC transporter permease n=1 Tax=Altibacter sp. HG106 TaxID=3023937 RepID=UPI00234FE096|nr:ABC transporter permease [Altibacter sp. HG106]MDC7995724.1 ABC transporter permease [Altibacter sp. HG106]